MHTSEAQRTSHTPEDNEVCHLTFRSANASYKRCTSYAQDPLRQRVDPLGSVQRVSEQKESDEHGTKEYEGQQRKVVPTWECQKKLKGEPQQSRRGYQTGFYKYPNKMRSLTVQGAFEL